MNQYIYRHYLSHGSDYIIFQARVSEGETVIVDLDECNFTSMFESIAYGTYVMKVASESWVSNPSQDTPVEEITFNEGNPYKNVKKYYDMEIQCDRPLSSLELSSYDNMVYLRFQASSLILEEGTDPVSEIAAMNVVSGINNAINTYYENGECLFKRKAASLGYTIEANKPDNECVNFLDKFFTELSEGKINRAGYNNQQQELLQQFIYSFTDIKKIKGLRSFSVTLRNGEELFIPLDNLYELKNDVRKRELNIIGVPEKVSFLNNSFWLNTDDASYACHLNEFDDTGRTLHQINRIASRQGGVQLQGAIYSDHPGTIKVSGIEDIDTD